jgi:hypothetical protein
LYKDKNQNKGVEVQKNGDYKQWLTDLKSRIRQSQIKAAVKVNTELLRLYWDLGRDIVARQMESAWGSGFFEQLSKDLLLEFPDLKGFSVSKPILHKAILSVL